MFDSKRTNVVNGAVVPQPANNSRFILAKTLTKITAPAIEEEFEELEYMEEMLEVVDPLADQPKMTIMKRLKNLFSFK